jgi:hypothetical protein
MPSGGDIIEITYNHPTIGTGVLYPKSSEDSTYDLGGFRSTDDANMIDGSGAMIDQVNRARWSFGVKIGWDMVDSGELETISALAAAPQQGTYTFTNINGTIYKGKGKFVGDVQGNGNTSTVDIKVSGGGILQII